MEVRYDNGALGPVDGAGEVDVAVMDNFIYGELQVLKYVLKNTAKVITLIAFCLMG